MPITDLRGKGRQLRQLQDQLQAQTRMVGITGKRFPKDLKYGDLTMRPVGNTLNVGYSDGKDVTEFPISRSVLISGGMSSSALPPSTVELPTDGVWGWHRDTTGPYYYIARNVGGTIVFPNFRSISGTISSAQHGVQTDPTLHAAVTAANNGFMIAADKAKLDNYPPDCTTVYNDNNAVKRAAGVINVAQVNVNGTKVLDARGGSVTHVTGTAAAPYDGATQTLINLLKTTVNDILNRMEAHGLISP